MIKCNCSNWAIDANDEMFLASLACGHNPNCKHFSGAVSDLLISLAKETIGAMNAWAADEDGIHPDAFDVYAKAKRIAHCLDVSGDCDA